MNTKVTILDFFHIYFEVSKQVYTLNANINDLMHFIRW